MYIDGSLYDKITILTAPIGHQGSQYGGPHSVTKSLINGLSQLGVPFNYNPSREVDVADLVIVLADPNALRQAITLKRSGRIKKLLAGPNLVVLAKDDGGILAAPEVDICIVPSYWVQPSYEDDQPSLKNRIQIWYAGVDVDYWRPQKTLQQKLEQGYKDVLVYWKTESQEFCNRAESALKRHGFNPIRLRYGAYSRDQFKAQLEKVLFAVFITRSESQGIAFAECWAMDVPTLVWDPQQPLAIKGKVHWPIAACPYLSIWTGLLWKNENELSVLVHNIATQLRQFAPRDWIIDNMTDEISAKRLYAIAINAPDKKIEFPFEVNSSGCIVN